MRNKYLKKIKKKTNILYFLFLLILLFILFILLFYYYILYLYCDGLFIDMLRWFEFIKLFVVH